ncbi:MAG: hypothetical protein ABFS35_18180 [Bacteroidota bacterium]
MKLPVESVKSRQALKSFRAVKVRLGIGYLGLLLPFVLLIGSISCGSCEEVQSSVSNYYHTNMRDILVGILFAVAMFFISYTGYDRRDDIATNISAIAMIGVALFPTSVSSSELTYCIQNVIDNGIISYAHFIFATILFSTLAYISLGLFTIYHKDNMSPQKRTRNKVYQICGYTIIGSIIIIAIYVFVLKKKFPNLSNFNIIFWFEAIALIAFGISWLVKGEALFRDSEKDEGIKSELAKSTK